MMPAFDPAVSIPTNQAECLGTLQSTWRAAPLSEPDIRKALEQPIWPRETGPSICSLIQPGESVVLVVSDHTRKTAAHRLLPLLVSSLTQKGCRLADMFILVASGIHRHPTAGEMEAILGPEMARAFQGRIFCHDPDDESNLAPIGITPRGHTVRLNRRAVAADRLILLGAATYHYHAGFGGGRKSLIPGLAARATIAHNHSLTLDPERDQLHPGVQIGQMAGNPVAEEMLAGARLHPPDFIVNTVLTPDGILAGIFAGDMELAHQAACRLVEQIDRVAIPRPADLVIASAGSASNWIQSHKALFNAHRAIGPEGRVILDAPCPEGLGNDHFRYWVTQPTVADIYAGLRKNPEVLGQTALSTRLRGPQTLLITSMPAPDQAALGIATAPDTQSAVRAVLDDFARRRIKRPTYYLMPNALSVVPFVVRSQETEFRGQNKYS